MEIYTSRLLDRRKVLLAAGLSIAAHRSPFGQGLASSQSSASTPQVDHVPKFALVPVGDYPNGYFEDIEVTPGSTKDLAVILDNWGEVAATLEVFRVNAQVAPNGGFSPGRQEDPPAEPTTWVDFPSREFRLAAGESTEILFKVSVPESTKPGQYLIGLMAQTAEPISISGTDTIEQVVGYLTSLSVLVPGELHIQFALGEPEVVEGRLVIPIENTGSYLVRPEGKLEVTDKEGEVVLSAPIQMLAVYGGLSTTVSVFLPEQLAPGEYALNLTLTDGDSGAMDSIERATFTVPEPVDPKGIFLIGASVEPNADEIAFANIDIRLNNGGQQIAATDVTLEVMRDGELVEEYPMATNQVLLSGENQFTDRYIPAEMWESGTYNFNLVVSAVDPNGGQETILLDEELDVTIEVP